MKVELVTRAGQKVCTANVSVAHLTILRHNPAFWEHQGKAKMYWDAFAQHVENIFA